jgi:hypothetical protein
MSGAADRAKHSHGEAFYDKPTTFHTRQAHRADTHSEAATSLVEAVSKAGGGEA